MPEMPYARLTLTKWVGYQPLDKSGTDLSPSPSSRTIKSDEQIWRRTFTVGNQWEKIPLGWLEGLPLAQIILFNEEGRFTQLQPTAEARAEAEARVVDIGVPSGSEVAAFSPVSPQQDAVFTPLENTVYWIRCRTDKAKLTVTAVPA